MIQPIPGCCPNVTIGELPTSFKESMTYYECVAFLTAKINELINEFNNVVDEKLSIYINEHFNDIMMDAIYDESTETLTLSLTEG